MKHGGFGFKIKWEEGDKMASIPLGKDVAKFLDEKTGKHPEEYIKEYINDAKLYKEVRDAYQKAENKAIPKDLDCKFCTGESQKEEDKACMRFRIQMGMTYLMAATDFVNIVERNRHVFRNKKFLRRLTGVFISCFYFHESSGMVWFDLPKLQKLCLSEGFLSLAEEFRKSDTLQNLVLINDTLDEIDTSLVRDSLSGGHDPNMYVTQKKFFEDKQRYYKEKMFLDKEQNKDKKTPAKTGKEKPTVPEYALYYFYLQQSKDIPYFENHEQGKIGAIEELVANGDIPTSSKYFQLEYNKICNHQSNRIAKNKVKSIQYVIENMLSEYPKAKDIASSERNKIRNI